MTKYRRKFKKIVWGYFEVHADSPEEAEQKYRENLYDEIDKKSEYELEEWVRDEPPLAN